MAEIPVSKKNLEIVFEKNVPVVAQITILEAVDFLYCLFTLQTVGRNATYEKDNLWMQYVTNLPGKILDPRHILTVETAYAGSVVEVIQGTAEPVEKLIEFLLMYDEMRKQKKVETAKQKLDLLNKQLFPLIDKLEKDGLPKEKIEQLRVRAFEYLEEVLAELIGQKKLEIRREKVKQIDRKV